MNFAQKVLKVILALFKVGKPFEIFYNLAIDQNTGDYLMVHNPR